MSYTGNNAVTQSFVAGTDYFSGDGQTFRFTLSRNVVSTNDIAVIISGSVLPPSAQNYSVLGNQLTLVNIPAVGINNLVVRYLTTVLWQSADSSNLGSGFLSKLIDVSTHFSSALLPNTTVTSVISSTQLQVTVSSGASALFVNQVISSTSALFSGVVIQSIAGASSPYTVTVSDTSQWGLSTSSLQGETVQNVVSTTVLLLSSVTGLVIGAYISATANPAAKVMITDISGFNVTVSSTSQWGPTGFPNNTSVYLWSSTASISTLYVWNVPNKNTTLVYNTTSQKWVNSPGQLQLDLFNMGVGNQVLNAGTAVGVGNLALGINALANLTNVLTIPTQGNNNAGIGNSAGSALTTSNNNLILGSFTGFQNAVLDIRTNTTPVGVRAVLTITLAAGTSAASASTLTITFGAAATTYLPASVTTASILASSNETIVGPAIVAALQADAIISPKWNVAIVGNIITMTQVVPSYMAFPLAAYASTWSSAPTTGLTTTASYVEAIIGSPNGNVILSDTSGNIDALINSAGWWGIGTNLPQAKFHINGLLRIAQAVEGITVVNTPLTGATILNINNGAVYLFSACTGNFNFNLTGDGTNLGTATINQILPTGHSLTIAIITTQGTTPYYHSAAFQVDGATPAAFKWAGTTSPSFGNANSFDVYIFSVFKTAPGTFTVLGSQSQYGG